VAINRLIHPQDLPQLINDTDQMRAAPGKSHLIAREYRIISGDGKIRWVHEMVRNIIDASEGKTRFYQGIILDITMRKRIEEELEDKRLHLDGILNSLQDVVWSIAPDTFELLYLNPAAEKVYGYKLADFRKHPQLWTLMIHPEDSDPVVDNFTSLLERGEFEAEFRIIRADGEVRLINRGLFRTGYSGSSGTY
jgi:PAS domain S-box-containing protein